MMRRRSFFLSPQGQCSSNATVLFKRKNREKKVILGDLDVPRSQTVEVQSVHSLGFLGPTRVLASFYMRVARSENSAYAKLRV